MTEKQTCYGTSKLISKFYITAKVHKNPCKSRPVVTICLHSLLRWADVYLQQLKSSSPAYLQDSYEPLAILQNLCKPPPGMIAFMMDAVAMYLNIKASHDLKILKDFIAKF